MHAAVNQLVDYHLKSSMNQPRPIGQLFDRFLNSNAPSPISLNDQTHHFDYCRHKFLYWIILEPNFYQLKYRLVYYCDWLECLTK